MTVNIISRTVGKSPRTITVNSKEYFVSFVCILGFKRMAKFPVMVAGESKTIYFELLGGSGAVFMDSQSQGYTTSDTIKKERNPITGEVDVTKLNVDYLGWHAIQAVLKRMGMGYKRLEGVTVKELKALARKAIETEQARVSIDGRTARIDICSSNLFRRDPERTNEDTWEIYKLSKITPVFKAVRAKVKAKGYKYTEAQINLIVELFSQVVG